MENQPKHSILIAFILQISAGFTYTFIRSKQIFLLFLFLGFIFSFLIAQSQYTYELNKTTRFDKMGVKDGLTTEYTTCIHQDQYGFIWIGTQRGLNLYNGYEVKVFNADPKNKESLVNDYIQSIYEEPDGTMWFCSGIGISKYNRANQTFRNYIPDTSDTHKSQNSAQKIIADGDYLWVDVWYDLFRFNKQTGTFMSFGSDTLSPSKGIKYIASNYIFIDRSEVLWVCSGDDQDRFALSRFNNETETFIHYQDEPSNLESFTGKAVRSMIEARDGTIWIATNGGLLEILDKEKGKFRRYIHDESDTSSIIHNNLQKVFEASNGSIWIGGENGFSQLNTKTGQFVNYQLPVRLANPNLSNGVKEFNEGENGVLWITANEGLYRFDPLTKNLDHFVNDLDNEGSLSDNNINQIVIDRSAQPWIITGNSGVNKINRFSNIFRKVQKKNYKNNSLTSNYVSRFFIDSEDNLWIGCYRGGGLNKTKMNNHKVFDAFEHFLFDANDQKTISSNSINAIYEDHEQIMWFGTFGGLNRFDHITNNFTRFQHKPEDSTTISSNSVESIFEDSYGTFWVGTRNGLNIMDKKTGKFIRILPDEYDSSSISSTDIRVIFEDSYGELWIGGTHLERLNRSDTSFVHYITNEYSSVLNLSEIWDIAEDDSTNLWLASLRGGLLKMNRDDMTFDAFNVEQGLPSNYTLAIEIDDNKDIWVSSNRGLSRINYETHEIKKFDDADGLINLELIDRSTYKDKDGWLYFGGRDGFNVFHPDSLKENACIPPVYITSMTVAGNQKYFDQPLYEMDVIELNYNENDISFDIVALNYINPQKNQFAYMLEGYDEDWKYAGDRRTAYYTNLSAGEYTFNVKASNNDGYWNEEGASLSMVIQPPFWSCWWAYLAYVCIFIGLLYLLRRYELNRLKHKQNFEINMVEATKLAEIDVEKNKFFSNISHEFRTPITLILGPLERIIRAQKNIDLKQELMLVRRNARRLQTLINQLLSLSKLESGKMQLKARPENIVKLSRLFVNSFRSMAEDKGIKLEFETDADEYIVYIDTLKIEKVANNLLSNAFKFTEKGGKIKVKIRTAVEAKDDDSTEQVKKGVYICISDTGIGIRKEKIPHVFDRFYQVDAVQMKNYFGTGIGLALTKELIELHHGTISVDSEPGMGTTFTVFLQTGKDHLSDDEISKSNSNGSENEDELLADDYLFVQDVVNKSGPLKPEQINKNLPLLLIVEDNDDMRAYIKSYLVGKYNILEATNGKEGAEIAIEQVPDLIVSDLMMPFVDGNEMTIQLKNDERTSHIPIILLTAKSSMESKLEGLETGADDFLTKPFDAGELLVRIKNLIEQRRKLRKLLFDHIGDREQTHLINESSGHGMSKMDEQFLERANGIIHEKMADPDFSVEILANEMAMSRVQLHRKLKSLTDHSASDLIRNIRLIKASELLKEGDLNVTQVSYEVGISSLSYFAKTFKERYGVSPSDYA